MSKSKVWASEIKKLFDLAVVSGGPTYSVREEAEAKLYEVFVAAKIIEKFKRDNPSGTVKINKPLKKHSGELIFAGSPASADCKKYSYFTLNDGVSSLDVWISLQFMSAGVGLSGYGTGIFCHKHEFDVSVIKSMSSYGSGIYPKHDYVILGVSCKHVKSFNKSYIREAIGFKMELSEFVHRDSKNIFSYKWISNFTNSFPENCVWLISSNRDCINYDGIIKSIDVHVGYVDIGACFGPLS